MRGRPAKSLAQRMDAEERLDAISTVTTTERLLVLILVELMQTRGQRGPAEIAKTLALAGFSTQQVAAMLGTTKASLHVAFNRSSDTVTP